MSSAVAAAATAAPTSATEDDDEYYNSEDFDDLNESHSDSSESTPPARHQNAEPRSRSASRHSYYSSSSSSAHLHEEPSSHDEYDDDEFEDEQDDKKLIANEEACDARAVGARESSPQSSPTPQAALSNHEEENYDSDDVTRSSLTLSTSSTSSAYSRHSSAVSSHKRETGNDDEASQTHRKHRSQTHAQSSSAEQSNHKEGTAVAATAAPREENAPAAETDTHATEEGDRSNGLNSTRQNNTMRVGAYAAQRDNHNNARGCRKSSSRAALPNQRHSRHEDSIALTSSSCASSSALSTSRLTRLRGVSESYAPHAHRNRFRHAKAISVEPAAVPQTSDEVESMKRANAELYEEIAQLLRARCHSLRSAHIYAKTTSSASAPYSVNATHTATTTANHHVGRNTTWNSKGRAMTVQEQAARVVYETLLNTRSAQLLRQEHRDLQRYSEALQDVVHQHQRATKYAHWLTKAREDAARLRARQRELKLSMRQNGKLLLKSDEQSDQHVDETKRLAEELRAREALSEARLTRAVHEYEEAERHCQQLRERVSGLQAELQDAESAVPEETMRTLHALWRERAAAARAVRVLTRRREKLARQVAYDVSGAHRSVLASTPHATKQSQARYSDEHLSTNNDNTDGNSNRNYDSNNDSVQGCNGAAPVVLSRAEVKSGSPYPSTFSSSLAERDYLISRIEHMKGVLARRNRGKAGGGAPTRPVGGARSGSARRSARATTGGRAGAGGSARSRQTRVTGAAAGRHAGGQQEGGVAGKEVDASSSPDVGRSMNNGNYDGSDNHRDSNACEEDNANRYTSLGVHSGATNSTEVMYDSSVGVDAKEDTHHVIHDVGDEGDGTGRQCTHSAAGEPVSAIVHGEGTNEDGAAWLGGVNMSVQPAATHPSDVPSDADPFPSWLGATTPQAAVSASATAAASSSATALSHRPPGVFDEIDNVAQPSSSSVPLGERCSAGRAGAGGEAGAEGRRNTAEGVNGGQEKEIGAWLDDSLTRGSDDRLVDKNVCDAVSDVVGTAPAAAEQPGAETVEEEEPDWLKF